MIPGRCRENIRQNDAIKERVVCHMARIGMIGAGSWGIALTVLLHNNGHDITVWSALKDEIDMLDREHEHKDKLPGVKLADDIVFTTALADAVKEKDILVLAVPSSFTRATACRGGRQVHSHHDRGRCKDQKDGGIYPVSIHE